MKPTPMIEMRNINKRFPGVYANQDVNLTVMPGEIHALLGENGAGKTTLMSILAGMYQPDSGSIWLNGRRIAPRSPHHALELGIGMIYQHFMLVPGFTVAENVVLGSPKGRFWLNRDRLNREIGEFAAQYGFNLNPADQVSHLSIGERQRVEIMRALYLGSKVLILDEPTTVLTPQEVKDLFAILRRMADQGKAIILITHKLNEVAALADAVTVLRKGANAGALQGGSIDEAALAQMMVGRDFEWQSNARQDQPGAVVLSARKLSVTGDRGDQAVRGIHLDVKAGEILALAGVAGNGQRELVEALAGLRDAAEGDIVFENRTITGLGVRERVKLGIRLVPEDRIGVGLVGNMGLADNLILRDYYRTEYSRGSILQYGDITAAAQSVVERFQIQSPDLKSPVREMSGGNLQRLLMAREMLHAPRVILAFYPARGLDIAAAEDVYRLLLAERDRGTAVLLVMEDLDEIMRVTDRVAVMYNGRLSDPLPTAQTNAETIGRLMGGMEGGKAS
ncbi:MAG: ABC transporter ATP-binding protein [Solirubrobacterales bacterium]